MSVPNLHGKIKMVFFDIDDTLFHKNSAYLPASVAKAIAKLKAQGIIPAIATGRALCSLPTELKPLLEQEKIDLLVTMNGQYVSYQDQQIEAHPISMEKIQQLVDFFQQHQIDYAFVSPQHLCVSNISPMLKQALDPITTNYQVDPDYFKQHQVYQLLAFYPANQDQLVQDSGILTGLKSVRWHENSVDLFDHAGSKARGIQTAIQHFGIKMEEVMAFGDGLNDMEMLSSVGVGVAMGNAHPELKAVADYVTENVEADGVYKFLLQAGLIQP